MPPKTKQAKRDGEHNDSASVTAFLAALEHPMKPVIQMLRRTILTADETITEGIKWNTASFYCAGWFATINFRTKAGVQVVLHQGAKIRENSTLSQTIDDPSQLLTWHSKDRATITFATRDDFTRKQAALTSIIKQWTGQQKHNANAA